MTMYRSAGPSRDVPKEQGVAHADAGKNEVYLREVLAEPKHVRWLTQNGIGQKWMGLNPDRDGKFEALVGLMFSWKDANGVNFGCPLSLHDRNAEFTERVNRFFRISQGSRDDPRYG